METPERAPHPLLGRTILLAEDNEDEVFMMQRTFKKANIPSSLMIVKNGEQVIEYLEGSGSFSDRSKFPMPTVLFLDLNMPKKSGLEVLDYVRQHASLRKLIVNILTSSTRPADIDRAAFLGANAFLVKPAQLDKFLELIQGWYNLARFEAFAVVS